MQKFKPGIFWVLLLAVFSSQAPGDLRSRLQLAQQQLDSARYEEALALAQEVLESAPDSSAAAVEGLLLLGNIFLETGQWEAARQQFSAALRRSANRSLLRAQAHNNLGEYHYKKGAYPQAEAEHRQALALRTKQLGQQHELVADSYNNLGNCRAALGDYAGATDRHREALSIRQNVLPANHPDLATSFNNLGNCAYLGGDAAAALDYFEQALRIRERAFGPEHPKMAQSLNNLGNALAALGRPEEAVRRFEAALAIRRKLFGDRHPSLAAALENIGDLRADQGDPIAALDHYRQAYAIQQPALGDLAPGTAALQHKIGLCFQEEGDFARALRCHLEAEPVLTAALGSGHPYVAGLYNNIGNCYAGLREAPRALNYYARALRLFQQPGASDPANLALVYNNIGTAQLRSGHADAALLAFEQALRLHGTARTAARALSWKNKGLALEKLGRWPEAREALQTALADTARFDAPAALELQMAYAALLSRQARESGSAGELVAAQKALLTALHTGSRLRARLNTPAARQHWLEHLFPLQSEAMEVLYRLWKISADTTLPRQAFALAEQNKSLQLLEQLRKERAGRFAGIPDSLLEQERQGYETLNRLEKQRLAWLQAGDSSRVQQAELDIAQARQAVTTLIRTFERQYPDYYRLKFDDKVVDPAYVQHRMLQPDQALLEYFRTDSAMFLFVIGKNRFDFLRLALDFPLERWVTELRHSLQGYPEASGRVADSLAQVYTQRAAQLYDRIMAPAGREAPLPEGLLLVPDGALSYLSFDCLLEKPPADYRLFKQHDYVLLRHRISWAYSATQHAALLQKESAPADRNLLAVAPAYSGTRFGLNPLHHNRGEARAVCALLDGDLREDSAAAAGRFLEEAGRYRILLLSTHGKASSSAGDLSYLAFSTLDSSANPFLFARDLYHQRIPAELVVLSACETSLGEYRTGQGVIGLASGFFHAGARSVVATLWSVDDAKNADLIRHFFENLKAGQPKDAALRDAKRRFLRDHAHDDAFPVYWAAVTAYGDTQPIDFETFTWNIWLGIPALVLAALWFFLKKLKKKPFPWARFSRQEHMR